MKLVPRKCACGCGSQFKVLATSKQLYASADHEIIQNGYQSYADRLTDRKKEIKANKKEIKATKKKAKRSKTTEPLLK